MAFTPKMSPVDIIGYLEIMLSHGPPKEARVFCSCCLDVVTSLQGTSPVAWSPWPAGVYSFWSVIQLTQTVSIYRQESNSSLFWWPGGAARGQQSQGGAHSWKRHAGPRSVFRGHIIAMKTSLTPIVLKFSLLHASIWSSSVFLTCMKTNW